MNKEYAKSNPIGVDDFKVLVSECYYVDKSKLIEEIISKGSQKSYLFTRPRRFGKSAVISMLYNFFNINDDTKELFKDLYIAKTPYMMHINSYPVIYINNKDFDVSTYSDMVKKFEHIVSSIYLEHRYLLEGDLLADIEKQDYLAVMNRQADITLLESSLMKLSHYLNRYHHRKVVVLIDEYDSPLTSSYEYGFFTEASRFFKSVYSQLLKSNYSLFFSILTGVLKVSKINLFSGLNNLVVDNGVVTYFDEYFGFTYPETKALLRYYDSEEYYDEVISWYGGYKFACEVVNPWSTLSFLLSKNIFRLYWSKTSSNNLLETFFNNIDQDEATEYFSSLINGKTIDISISENYNYDEMKDINSLSNFLISTGYLTCSSNNNIETQAYIPNREIKELFKIEILQRYRRTIKIDNSLINDLKYNLVNQNDEKAANNISELLKSVITYYEFNNEQYYQVFMGVLTALLFDECSVSREESTGEGRCDIMLVPKKGYNFGAIIELKYNSSKISKERLKQSANVALNQIIKKDYINSPLFDKESSIYIYGVAFYKKNVQVVSEKLR